MSGGLETCMQSQRVSFCRLFNENWTARKAIPINKDTPPIAIDEVISYAPVRQTTRTPFDPGTDCLLPRG